MRIAFLLRQSRPANFIRICREASQAECWRHWCVTWTASLLTNRVVSGLAKQSPGRDVYRRNTHIGSIQNLWWDRTAKPKAVMFPHCLLLSSIHLYGITYHKWNATQPFFYCISKYAFIYILILGLHLDSSFGMWKVPWLFRRGFNLIFSESTGQAGLVFIVYIIHRDRWAFGKPTRNSENVNVFIFSELFVNKIFYKKERTELSE